MTLMQMMMGGGDDPRAQQSAAHRVSTAMAFIQIMGPRFYRVRNWDHTQTARPMPLTPSEELAYCASLDLLELYFRGGFRVDDPPPPPGRSGWEGPPDPPPPASPPAPAAPSPIPNPEPVNA